MTDNSLTIQRIIEIRAERSTDTVKDLKQEISDLKDALLNVKEGTADYDKGVKLLQEDQRRLNEVNALTKKENVALAGSYYDLNARLVQARKDYKNLTAEQRNNAEVGGVLLNEIRNLDTQLKTLDASMGQYQRNVGNYTQSILEAGQSLGGSFGGAVTGIKNANNALKIMSANPIIAILGTLAMLLSKVIGGLKTSEKNANAAAEAFSGFKVVGDMLTKVLQGLGSVIAKIGDGFTKLLSRIDKVNEKMKERRELAREEIALAKQSRDTIMKNADDELAIAELRAKSADKLKYTAKERIAFLEEAAQKEADIAARAKKAAEDEYNLLVKQHSMTDTSKEELDEEAEAYAKMVQAQTNYFNKTRELTAQVVEAKKQIRQENAQTTKDDIALLKIEKDLTAQRIAVVEKGTQEELDLKRQQRELEYEIEITGYNTSITNATKRAEAVKLAEQKKAADIERYERDHVKAMLAIDLQMLANRRDVYVQGSREYLTVQEEYLRQNLENIEKLGREAGETETAFQARRLAAQRAYYDAANANADAFIGEGLIRIQNKANSFLEGSIENLTAQVEAAKYTLDNIYQQEGESYEAFVARKLEADKTYYNAKKALDEAENELMRNKVRIADYSLSAILSLYETFGGEQAKQSQSYKAIASAQAMVQAFLAANEAYASMASIPVVGPGLGIAAAAAALAAGMAQVHSINATQMSKTATPTATSPATPAASVSAPAVIQQVATTRTVTGVQEEQRMNKATRVYLVYDDVEQAGKKVNVQTSEATF